MSVKALDWKFDPGPVLVSPNALSIFGHMDWAEKLVYERHVFRGTRTLWEVNGWKVLVVTRKGKKGKKTFTSVVVWEERKRWNLK